MRELAIGFFVGGLSYIPLCLLEMRLSPQLHRIVYGGSAGADFSQTVRLGGYRPTVFLSHGLAVGAFMMAATLIGIWLWQTGTVKRLWNIPVGWLVGALFVTFILTRSTGAYALLAGGIAVLFIGKNLRTAVPAFILIAGTVAYLYINAVSGTYVADQIVESLSKVLPEDRVGSLEFRFDNEEILSAKARERVLFGWGGYGRALIERADGSTTIPDSLWINIFGQNGAVGLVSLFVTMLIPTLSLFWMRYPARLWADRRVASAAVIALMTALYMVDCLINAMVNPIYILAAGGIAGLVLKRERINKTTQKSVERSLPSQRYAIQQR
jgi:O-antigen ligase